MERRSFLQTSAAALGLTAAAKDALGALVEGPAKRVGLIGTGWYGKIDLLRLIQVAPVDVVSLCDVDSQMLDGAADIVATRQASGKRPRLYGDYREMLAEKDLDLVLIGTPDHWHALTMIAAVESGADVYVQKPTAVDVVESHAMLNAARTTNRVVQVGTQRRSTPHLIEARERVVKAGLLGNAAHADVFCYYHMRSSENPPNSPPPATLDYEMWTGIIGVGEQRPTQSIHGVPFCMATKEPSNSTCINTNSFRRVPVRSCEARRCSNTTNTLRTKPNRILNAMWPRRYEFIRSIG